MSEWKVIEYWEDLQDERHKYNANDPYPREGLEVTPERIAELASNKNKRKRPLIKKDSKDAANYPKHTGGGWYELSNGEKVQGKEDAEEAQAKL